MYVHTLLTRHRVLSRRLRFFIFLPNLFKAGVLMYILPPPHAPRPSLARADVEFRTCVSAPQAHLKTMRVNGVLRTTVRISSWSRCHLLPASHSPFLTLKAHGAARAPPAAWQPPRPPARTRCQSWHSSQGRALWRGAPTRMAESRDALGPRYTLKVCVLSSYILHSTAPGTGGANIPPRPAACAYMTLA